MFLNFFKAFDSIHWGKIEQILLALNGDTDFFNIVTGVLQGDILAPYLFVICLNYVLWISIDLIKENSLTLKTRSRWYPAETMTDADYANDLVLLANTPAQAKCLLHGLEQTAGSIVCANKTEFMYFKREGAIITLQASKIIWQVHMSQQ